MAYTLPFGSNVNQLIGRYAVGFPSDRIKDMMKCVERKEIQCASEAAGTVDLYVIWNEVLGPARNLEICLLRKLLREDCPIEEAQTM